MRGIEQKLQQQVATYLGWALEPPAWFSSIPAGGGGEMRGRIIKGTGYKAGTPDLLIVSGGRAHFIELKAPRGVLSEAQRRTIPALEAAGAGVVVAYSLDTVRGALFAWGIPTRETKPATERIRRGILAAQLNLAGGLTDAKFPESDRLGRKRRAKA